MTASVFADLVTPNGIRYRQPLGLFINNQFVESRSGETISTIDPANEEEIARVHAADTSDVEDAVRAAREAFEGGWIETPGTDRGRLLYKLADLIEQHGELLAAIESWDNGKPYSTAILEDLPEVVAMFRYYAGWADKSYGQGTLNYMVAEPIGVCGQIIPWNYPIVMASWKLAPALAAGNTVVLKAWEQTPLSALFLATVAGAALASHLDVDKIAFTGSTKTGKEIMKLASSNLKSVILETGGKSPLIVFNDADLHAAVAAAYLGFDRILSYVESGGKEGAQLIYGGKLHKSLNGKGFFIEPTIFTNVTPEMRIYREEIFGPFVVMLSFKTESEVVRMANDTEYGLAAAVFTRDIARAHRITRKIKAGTVWINNSQTVDPRVPFGGFKQSGIGQEQ
ncbi:Aldehyde/histidinol dehydrogenase [Dactylonectria estremocensis]|uniref:aldehyde dehydrogenase (NAD(+)) n=1 Tax=Dactylonectria estremocensis TaxID=1079267 RepID=A0A9P9FD10_9HYPO|nr:Aldehyde/histidinol dehydrogenase [Dactylonectria estremocensis]